MEYSYEHGQIDMERNENLPTDSYIHRERQRDRYIQTLALQNGGEGSFSK